MSGRQTPNEFLKQIIGRPVVVKLNNGADYRGNVTKLNHIHIPVCVFIIITVLKHMQVCLLAWMAT